MNFLAHCLIGVHASRALSPADARHTAAGLDLNSEQSLGGELLVGGFLGDFIKGPMPGPLPESLATGVRLHRRIDAYSNQHPGIRRSCDRFQGDLRRLAPVLVDIIADHCLARRWGDFHDESLVTFTASSYREISSREAWLPDSGKRFLEHMQRVDLLAGYQDWGVTERALRSVTRRLRREHLNPSMADQVPPMLDSLEADFKAYFPDMLSHGTDWLKAVMAGR